MDPVHFYEQSIVQFEAQLRSLKQRHRNIAMARLFNFLAISYSIYHYWGAFNAFAIVLIIALIVLFIFMVRKAIDLKEAIALAKNQLSICRNEIVNIQSGENMFTSGEELLNASPVALDLDLFGNKSLFHYLNRTTTSYGHTMLSQRILYPSLDIPSLENEQAIISEYATYADERIRITAEGLMLEEDFQNMTAIREWVKAPVVNTRKTMIRFMRWFFPLAAFACVVLYAFTEVYYWLLIPVIVLFGICTSMARKYDKSYSNTSRFQAYIDKYYKILHHFSAISVTKDSALYPLTQQARAAADAFNLLNKRIELLDARNNLVVLLFLNSFLFYEMQCIWLLEDWKKQYQHKLNEWEQLLATIEYYNSLAGFCFNHPGYQFPTFTNSEHIIEAKQVFHPLLKGYVVANDLSLGSNETLILLTGSNMSGKTTFLRTIGVNVILAQLGAPVAAAAFTLQPMVVMSSIRVSDSLQENTSYFKAELNQLKDIIDHLRSQKIPTLVLIDEILKGTNSEDKTLGSAAYMQQLMRYGCLAIFATHDLVLSGLEKDYPGKMSNYCFESTIENDVLEFNYLLERGVAKNKNASFLMRQMGIIN